MTEVVEMLRRIEGLKLQSESISSGVPGKIFLCDHVGCLRMLDAVCAFTKANMLELNLSNFAFSGEKIGRKGVQLFSSNELKMATNSFASENKLANGACGDVYKGLLRNGQVVAIKRAKTDTAMDMEQFFNEVSVLSQVTM